jgi:hypothetical protein
MQSTISCIEMTNDGSIVYLRNSCDIVNDTSSYAPLTFSRRVVQADVQFAGGKILKFRIETQSHATFGLSGGSASLVKQGHPDGSGEDNREHVQLYLEDGDYWLNCFRPTYVLLRRTLTNISDPKKPVSVVTYEDWVVGGSLGANVIGGGPSTTEFTTFEIIKALGEPVERI